MHFNSLQEYLQYHNSAYKPVEPERFVEPAKAEEPKQDTPEEESREQDEDGSNGTVLQTDRRGEQHADV